MPKTGVQFRTVFWRFWVGRQAGLGDGRLVVMVHHLFLVCLGVWAVYTPRLYDLHGGLSSGMSYPQVSNFLTAQTAGGSNKRKL